MKLIVGLGNPGKEYKNTRHNIGFMVLDEFLGKVGWKEKMEAYFYTEEVNGEQVIFIKPMTYMNLSGLAVAKIVNYHKIDMANILIIHDDLDLDLGRYRVKHNSSSGGHNGIKSIISELDSQEFFRLKIGIGKSAILPTDRYVLGKFSKEELTKIIDNMDIYKNIIRDFIQYDGNKILEYNK